MDRVLWYCSPACESRRDEPFFDEAKKKDKFPSPFSRERGYIQVKRSIHAPTQNYFQTAMRPRRSLRPPGHRQRWHRSHRYESIVHANPKKIEIYRDSDEARIEAGVELIDERAPEPVGAHGTLGSGPGRTCEVLKEDERLNNDSPVILPCTPPASPGGERAWLFHESGRRASIMIPPSRASEDLNRRRVFCVLEWNIQRRCAMDDFIPSSTTDARSVTQDTTLSCPPCLFAVLQPMGPGPACAASVETSGFAATGGCSVARVRSDARQEADGFFSPGARHDIRFGQWPTSTFHVLPEAR
jgi:hypothetical protein